MNDFRAFLESIGLVPDRIIADGKRHHCKTVDRPRKKNGEYRFYSSGRAGYGINHRTMTEWAEWRASADAEYPAFDPAVLAKERASHAADLRLKAKAVRAVRKYFDSLPELRNGHPYLSAKDLDMTGCRGLRVDSDGGMWLTWQNYVRAAEEKKPLRHDPVEAPGYLVIPMYEHGKLVSVQRIAPNGEKLYWSKGKKTGASYMIDRSSASITVLCEGFATGVAIFAAVPTARVIVAFDSGNLQHVAPTLSGMCVVAADNDWETEARIGKNPGLLAAREAAALVGCGVAYPRDIEGTDFADMRQELVTARMAKRLPHEREGAIRRAVDALIAGEIMRNATFISAAQKA